MPRHCFLAHDVGTTATKTSIVSADGRIVDSEARAHGTATPAPGRAEQDPEDWWSGVCRNTEAVLGRHPDASDRIAAIGVSGHMLGCTAVDRDGEPVRPAMIHSDTRAARQYERVRDEIGADQLYQTSGNILDPRSPLCKLLWLKENEPSNYESAARFMQSKDFIVGRMVGRFDSTDYSDACHAQWMDIRDQSYAEDVFGTLGLDVGKMPGLHPATEVVGTLRADAASALGLPDGIPVVAGGGDGSCATVGAGAVHRGDTYCCIGSTAWIACTLEEPLLDPQRRVFNLSSLDGERCAVYGTVQSAGRSLDWVMDLLDETGFDRFEGLLEEAGAGSDGLIFLPYLEGERSPIYDADARGVFFGITPAHERCHFLRATVEGVSYALRSVL
ncbi:MAG: FGGY family carbohydrate kinase, partial [Candidatus Brocadiaceae bacterium]